MADTLKAIANFGVTDFERNFEFEGPHGWISSHWNVPIVAIVTYLIFCYKGGKEMAPRAPFDLKMELMVWNALLSLFSFVGMMRTAPFLLARLMEGTFRESVCTEATESYGTGAVGFWTYMFILSKLPELIDTVFIVLRKKKLIFLHWYHHVTVLLYCWHAYSTKAASGLYFVAMNYSVHALMYGYFCLQTVNKVPKNFPTYLITIMQISQMFVGTFVCVSCWYYYSYTAEPCHNDFTNLIAGGMMYGSYFYLFVKFAVTRFLLAPPPKSSKESKKGK
jgi:hypothetical protein